MSKKRSPKRVDVKQLYGTSVHLWNGSREHATIWLESLAATVACLKHLCDMYNSLSNNTQQILTQQHLLFL